MDEQISLKEFGELAANVRILVADMREMKMIYATKAEIEPRLQSLEQDKHAQWSKVSAFCAVGGLLVSGIALFRTFSH